MKSHLICIRFLKVIVPISPETSRNCGSQSVQHMKKLLILYFEVASKIWMLEITCAGSNLILGHGKHTHTHTHTHKHKYIHTHTHTNTHIHTHTHRASKIPLSARLNIYGWLKYYVDQHLLFPKMFPTTETEEKYVILRYFVSVLSV